MFTIGDIHVEMEPFQTTDVQVHAHDTKERNGTTTPVHANDPEVEEDAEDVYLDAKGNHEVP